MRLNWNGQKLAYGRTCCPKSVYSRAGMSRHICLCPSPCSRPGTWHRILQERKRACILTYRQCCIENREKWRTKTAQWSVWLGHTISSSQEVLAGGHWTGEKLHAHRCFRQRVSCFWCKQLLSHTTLPWRITERRNNGRKSTWLANLATLGQWPFNHSGQTCKHVTETNTHPYIVGEYICNSHGRKICRIWSKSWS